MRPCPPRLWRRPAWLLATLTVGCGLAAGCSEAPEADAPAQMAPAADAGVAPDAAPPAACPARFGYDPVGQPETLTSFPDDFWTVDDPGTATGLRVQIDGERAAWLADTSDTLVGLYAAMGALDGFGTSAPVFVRLAAGTFPPLAEVHPGLLLVDLSVDPPEPVPYEPVRLDDGQALALWPAWPLRSGAQHAVVLTDALEAQEGCIDPSEALVGLLQGEGDGRLGALAPRYAALPGQLGLAADAVRGATVFTTQTVHASSQAVAADIAGAAFDWLAPPTCEATAQQVHCEGTFMAGDYRTDGVVQGAAPAARYALPVSVWYPAQGEGPWPTYLVGHGLGGDRSLGSFVSRLTGDSPIAVIAIDAVAHGEHPGGVGSDAVDLLTRFFAVDLAARYVDGLALRDNFRQSTFDKLQALALIRQHPDLDGDGRPEVDVDRLGYFGFSLGGIMGSELLALDDGLSLSILGMPGGRLSRIMRDGEAFAVLLNFFVSRNATDEARERLFGALQTVVEQGDPVNYGGHVLGDRLSGAEGGPHTLMVMAVDDQVVPNSTTASLAAAWQVPPVRPTLVTFPWLPDPADAPLTGNRDGLTGGLFQYKTVSEQEISGVVRRQPATHENVMLGRETILQVRRFHRAWADGETPSIINPADEL